MSLKIKVLSWLLHHANRKYHNPEFYQIKNRLLKCYGEPVGFDLQFIEGKKCFTCYGAGIFVKYDFYGHKLKDICWNCDGTGWYRPPFWTVLQKYQFGRYRFHQPIQKVYKKPDIKVESNIEGYVEHTMSKHSDFAATILFLIYERGYLKRWYSGAGQGRYVRWWLPQHWLNNIIYHIKHRPRIREVDPQSFMACYQDDLPF